MTQQGNYLPKVREQYEALPYPPVDPQDDTKKLAITTHDQLAYLNHRFFDGAETFGTGFRALCAGDGTGNASIFLAEQLAATGGHVVALDMSEASQAIAKERATIRKLTNITHIRGSLLDVRQLGIGEFDYINCAGVLHHLADPVAGLRALASVLKPTGVMGIMVYGQIGRTAIYHLQDALRRMFAHEQDMQKQITLTRAMLTQLPPTNWVHHDEKWPTRDWASRGDSGLFDLLLHTQDRAYTVPQIYEWVQNCGLHLAEFTVPYSHQEVGYNPLTYVNDTTFAARVNALPQHKRHAIAELLCGTFDKHEFYVTASPPAPELSGSNHSLIPAYGTGFIIMQGECEYLQNIIRSHIGKKTVMLAPAGIGQRVKLTPHDATATFFGAINNQSSIADIIAQAATANPSLSSETIAHQWDIFYQECRLQSLIVLRRAGGAAIPTAVQLNAQAKRRG